MTRAYVLGDVVSDSKPNYTLIGSAEVDPDVFESTQAAAEYVLQSVIENQNLCGNDLVDTECKVVFADDEAIVDAPNENLIHELRN